MTPEQNIKSNIPEFTVSELSASLKRTLEDQYGRVRLRGELSRVSLPSSGHMYTSLKDENAVIDAVCWRGTVGKLSIKPEEGLDVICTGRITSYAAQSKYQIIIESMELAGEGALLKMLEDRRKKLAAEGLFAEDHKKPLPFLPEVIGVITSPTGAVIRDILHRLEDRFPRRVLLWPVPVQGEQAADKIVAALQGFSDIQYKGLPRPDLLIVARGGGSLEDLMPFNEENVVRAAYSCPIPIISAVGHETDTTLLDFVADRRAPTPTGAAEIAVPRKADLQARLYDIQSRLWNSVARLAETRSTTLHMLAARMGEPSRMLEAHAQRMDNLGGRLSHAFAGILGRFSERLIYASGGLLHPRARLMEASGQVRRWAEALSVLPARFIKEAQTRLNHADKMLHAYSFENVLDRGFTLLRDAEGTIVADPPDGPKDVEVLFRGGRKAQAQISSPQKPGHQKPGKKSTNRARKKGNKNNQQELF